MSYQKIMPHEVLADLHTHTIFSEHAFSTISENMQQALLNGVEFLACTDHFLGLPPSTEIPSIHDDLAAKNERYRIIDMSKVVNRSHLVHVIGSAEFNLSAPLDKYLLSHLSWRPIGLHSWFYHQDPSNHALLIRAFHNAAAHGFNAFVHIERCLSSNKNPEANAALLIEIINIAAEHNVYIEVNETSLRESAMYRPYVESALRYCKEKGVHIYLGSDAHIAHRVGTFPKSLALINKVEYPRDLILNLNREKLACL